MLGIILLICYDQGQKRNSLSRSRRHLQDTVTTCVQGFFDGAHVFILLRVNPRVRKEDREVTARNGERRDSNMHRLPYSMLNFIVTSLTETSDQVVPYHVPTATRANDET